MNFEITSLHPNDSKNLENFIKHQSEDDLFFFSRWKNYDSSNVFKKIIFDECNISPEIGVRIVAKNSSNEIIGFGLIDFFKEKNKKHVSIVGTIVDKKYRGLKIGKKLLEHEIQISKNNKKIKIRATAHEHNIASVKLHQSLGFSIEGKFVNEEFDTEYRNVLSLALFVN